MNYGGEKAIYPLGGVAAGVGVASGLSALWLFLAAFALLSLGLAIWRIVPRSEA